MPDCILLSKSSFNGNALGFLQKSFGEMKIPVTLFRWLVLLTFFSYSAIWTTGYLRTLLPYVFAVLIFAVFRGKAVDGAKPIAGILSIAALAYAIWQRTGPVPGVIILLNFASIILLLQILMLDDNRSAAGALVLSMMIILAVAAMNVNFIFPMVLVPYLIVFYRILREFALIRHRGICNYSFSSNPHFSYAGKMLSGLLIFLIFLFFWLVIFYLIPRNESFSIASETSRRRLKGFSETLSITEAGLLEDNPAVIMRIIPVEEKTLSVSILRRMKNKLLRGATFATYNEGRWERGTRRQWYIDARRTDGEIRLGKDYSSFRDLHQLEIFLENTEPPVMFVPDNTYSLHVAVPYVAVEDDGSLFFHKRTTGNRRYRVDLFPDPLEPDESSVSDIPVTRETALYLNTRGTPEKIAALAQKLASGTDSIVTRVERTISHLRANCSYSLYQLPSNIDPVEDFLFASKSGTCEHFATAMALILRSMGIPARPVGGYAMGDWNEIGGFFTVRQRHAHTWVEVYFPGNGWVSFDPTPAQHEDTSETEISRFFTALWETYEGYWFNYVYNFDNKAQQIGFRKISHGLSGRLTEIFALIFKFETFLIIVFMLVLFRAKFKKMLKQKQKTDVWIPEWYLEWESSLPIKREQSETPSEFHNRLMQQKLISSEDFALLEFVSAEINESAFSCQVKRSVDKDFSAILKKIHVNG